MGPSLPGIHGSRLPQALDRRERIQVMVGLSHSALLTNSRCSFQIARSMPPLRLVSGNANSGLRASKARLGRSPIEIRGACICHTKWRQSSSRRPFWLRQCDRGYRGYRSPSTLGWPRPGRQGLRRRAATTRKPANLRPIPYRQAGFSSKGTCAEATSCVTYGRMCLTQEPWYTACA